MTRQIPQCDPLAAYRMQAGEIDAAIHDVLASGRYILGPHVASFERAFSQWIGASHGLGVANGTDALEIALRALGIGAGCAVATTSMSAVATTVAIRTTGAIPLFADVDREHGLIDPEELDALFAAATTPIRAIVPVHLYGRCVDMDAVMRVAEKHSVPVVEDCAQAHGARWAGRAAGTFGAFGCFSFYPTKNLGAIGDGGALVTDDPALLERARLLREYGWKRRYISDSEGGNSRLDELQAAILEVKLARLDEDNHARRALAKVYRERIIHPDVRLFRGDDTGHVYHQFVVRTGARDALQAYLAEHAIGSLVHYPAAIHQQPAYANPEYAPLPLAATERWSASALSLPMYPQMCAADAMRVADAINDWKSLR